MSLDNVANFSVSNPMGDDAIPEISLFPSPTQTPAINVLPIGAFESETKALRNWLAHHSDSIFVSHGGRDLIGGMDSEHWKAVDVFSSDSWLYLLDGAKLSSNQQQACLDELKRLSAVAGKPNWDGEGASPVQGETIQVAEQVIPQLPGNIEPPEISADPNGNVEFDWDLDNGLMFTISVGADGALAVSAMHRENNNRLSAIQKMENQPLPGLLVLALRSLREMNV